MTAFPSGDLHDGTTCFAVGLKIGKAWVKPLLSSAPDGVPIVRMTNANSLSLFHMFLLGLGVDWKIVTHCSCAHRTLALPHFCSDRPLLALMISQQRWYASLTSISRARRRP